MQQLRDVGCGGEQQDDIVERHGTDEVQEEPRFEVAFRNLPWLEDNLVGKVVRYDPCLIERHNYRLNNKFAAALNRTNLCFKVFFNEMFTNKCY